MCGAAGGWKALDLDVYAGRLATLHGALKYGIKISQRGHVFAMCAQTLGGQIITCTA